MVTIRVFFLLVIVIICYFVAPYCGQSDRETCYDVIYLFGLVPLM